MARKGSGIGRVGEAAIFRVGRARAGVKAAVRAKQAAGANRKSVENNYGTRWVEVEGRQHYTNTRGIMSTDARQPRSRAGSGDGSIHVS